MKKLLILFILIIALLITPFTLFAESNKFYTIVCNPGEEASTEMRINWHTNEGITDSYVLYSKKTDTKWESATKVTPTSFTNNSFTQPNASGQAITQNGAVLSNLDSDTEYMYKITDGNNSSDVRYFKTAATNFSFIWSSDFHAYYDDGRRLKNATENIEEAIKINKGVDFILSTGDYVAHGGTYKWWKQVSEASWMKNYMFVSTLGNHDWMTSKGTTVSDGASHNFFSAFQNNPKNGYEGQENVCYYFYYGDALFIVLNTEEYSQKQYNWAEEVLKNANSQYIFMIQHYQTFNKSGAKNSAGYTRWHDLCDKYGVDIFFSGNSHVYVRSKSIYKDEVSKDKYKGTVYMVAPSSDGDRGETFNGFSSNLDLLEYGWANGSKTVACSIVNVTEGGISTRLVNKGGEILDSMFIPAKRPATSRTTHDLNGFNKEDFEKNIDVSYNSKDFSKPRVKVAATGYDVLRSIKIVNTENNEVYYYGKTPKGISYFQLENMNKGVYKLKIELDYYDNTLQTIYKTLQNTPKFGSINNIKYDVVNNTINLKWTEKFTLDSIKSVDIYINNELYKSLEKGIGKLDITSLNYNTTYDICIKVIDEDGTVLALYENTCTIDSQKFKVTFIGFNNKNLGIQEVEAGKSATAPDAEIIDGYTFIKWDKDFSNVSEDITVNAIYEKNKVYYKVTFVDSNNNVIEETQIEEGLSATSPKAPLIDGYEFTGWDKDFSKVTSDLTIKALYKKIIKTYTVIFKDKDGNELSKEEVEENTSARSPEVPLIDGYEFTGWDKDFSKVTSDLTINALYKEVTKESGCKSGSILFTSLLLLGLCLLKKKRFN